MSTINSINTELRALEQKIKDEANLSFGRKQTFLQNIEGCRAKFRNAMKEIDDAMAIIGSQIDQHFDEHITAITEFVDQPAEQQQEKEAA